MMMKKDIISCQKRVLFQSWDKMQHLEDALEKVYGDTQFPFDNGDAYVYYSRTNKHLNVMRMLFVDAMILNYEEAHRGESV